MLMHYTGHILLRTCERASRAARSAADFSHVLPCSITDKKFCYESVRFQTYSQTLGLLRGTMAPPRVVIVGGGIGGVTAAQQLAGFADVTLIDRQDQWLCLDSILREN